MPRAHTRRAPVVGTRPLVYPVPSGAQGSVLSLPVAVTPPPWHSAFGATHDTARSNREIQTDQSAAESQCHTAWPPFPEVSGAPGCTSPPSAAGAPARPAPRGSVAFRSTSRGGGVIVRRGPITRPRIKVRAHLARRSPDKYRGTGPLHGRWLGHQRGGAEGLRYRDAAAAAGKEAILTK